MSLCDPHLVPLPSSFQLLHSGWGCSRLVSLGLEASWLSAMPSPWLKPLFYSKPFFSTSEEDVWIRKRAAIYFSPGLDTEGISTQRSVLVSAGPERCLAGPMTDLISPFFWDSQVVGWLSKLAHTTIFLRRYLHPDPDSLGFLMQREV